METFSRRRGQDCCQSREKNSSSCIRGVRTDCGRRLQTQIHRNYRIRGLTADGCFWERCTRGLMRITIPQHEMDATHEPIAAWTGNAAASVLITVQLYWHRHRVRQCWAQGVNGMGASWHHQLQQHTAGAGQHPTTLRRPGTGEVDNVRQWHVGRHTNRHTEYRQSDMQLDTGGANPLLLDWAQGL